MPVTAKQKVEHIKVTHFITDAKGNKMAAVIDIEELKRIETVLDIILPLKHGFTKTRKHLKAYRGA